MYEDKPDHEWLSQFPITFDGNKFSPHYEDTRATLSLAEALTEKHDQQPHWAVYTSAEGRQLIKTGCDHIGECPHHNKDNADDTQVPIEIRALVVEIDNKGEKTEDVYKHLSVMAVEYAFIAGLPLPNITYASKGYGVRIIWVFDEALTDGLKYERYLLGVSAALDATLGEKIAPSLVDPAPSDWTRRWLCPWVVWDGEETYDRPVTVLHQELARWSSLPEGGGRPLTDEATIRSEVASREDPKTTPLTEAQEYNDNWIEERIPGFLLARPWFYERIWEWLSPDWLRGPQVRILLTAMKRFRRDEGFTPTARQALSHLAKGLDGQLLGDEWRRCQEIMYSMAPEDESVIERHFKDLIKAKVYEHMITADASIDALVDKDFGVLDERFDRLNEINRLLDGIGQEKPEMVLMSKVPKPDPSDRVPSPWPEFNDAVGGLEPGEVVGITGGTGEGKSLILTWIVGEMSSAGENVLFINFENSNQSMVVGTAMAAAGRSLGSGSARQVLRGLKSEPAIWKPREAFMTLKEFTEKIEAFEKDTERFHRILVIDPVDEIRDADEIKKHGSVWQAQEATLRSLQAWMEDTGRVGFFSLQINRAGVQAGKKGQRRSGADISGSFGRWQKVQTGLILERGDAGPRLVVDKCREGSAKLQNKALTYEYVEGNGTEDSRGFLRYRGIQNEGEVINSERDKRIDCVVTAIRARDAQVIPGLVVDERKTVGARGEDNPYFGMVGMPKAEFNAMFPDTTERGYALQELRRRDAIHECAKSRFAGEQKTWIVFQ